VQPQSAPLSEEDKMPRIKGDEAKRLFDKGEAVLVDVRSADQYKQSHAKPAISIPLMEIEAGNFGSLPKDKRIIAYCT
jgi:rhodanese-related sulfurtransferase